MTHLKDDFEKSNIDRYIPRSEMMRISACIKQPKRIGKLVFRKVRPAPPIADLVMEPGTRIRQERIRTRA